ncbi:hypothetical protein [Qipengyuania sp.]|uniref:COG4705 family protein n=1 Tax=Qipengyuania sp. TaxID=2004515 RepID=UPI003510E892
MKNHQHPQVSKVPAATAAFWLVKILATTVGEVGGNLLSMDWNLGYLEATAILGGAFATLCLMQIHARRFHSGLYWATIIASTTAGTTLADFTTRSIGLGYSGGSLLLLGLVLASLSGWKQATGGVSADLITDRKTEAFYWITITFSQTLGTALGDWFADTAGFGYGGSAVIFGAIMMALLALHYARAFDRVILFWAAFILSRPLGAVIGNFFDKPLDNGGLAMSRPLIVVVISLAIIVALAAIPQKAGHHRNTHG